ncbi:unnamed protein product [Ophioblennius macclurei]
MSSPSGANNVSVASHYRDTASTAVAKNVIVLALGVGINYINGTLIHTFRKHQIFYLNPRYILFIHLVINDVIQLSTSVGLFVSSYIFYKINVSVCCFILLFAVLTTTNMPLNLAVMAVECYVAVCFPLRHNELWSTKRTYALIAGIWALSSINVVIDFFVVVTTEPLSWFLSKMLCEKRSLLRHPLSTKIHDVNSIICLVVVWITIFYTYIHIIVAAKAAKEKKSSSDATKARNTILLHSFQLLLCMMTYMNYPIAEALLSWFPQYYVHVMFACFVLIQILPRFISPVVYGLRDKTFKQYLKKYYQCIAESKL